jgi:ribonuclease R
MFFVIYLDIKIISGFQSGNISLKQLYTFFSNLFFQLFFITLNKIQKMKSNTKKLKQQIVKIFKNNPQTQYNYKQISKILNIENTSQRRKISSILQQLTKEGQLSEIKKGKYQLKSVKGKIIGTLDMSARRDGIVYSEELGQDIHISIPNLHHALHNDIVEVSIFAKSKKNQLQGEITKIIKRNDKPFVGTIIKSENFAFVTIDDRLMPFDIFIPLKKLSGAKHGDKVIVKITDWPEYAKNPMGEIIDVLGKAGEHNVEMHAILAEFGLPYKFPEEVNIAAKKLSTKITPEDIKKRKDYRKTLTFTIDPSDAKDFDDALSFKKIDENKYEIGIHIADVTHYIKPGSIIDKEAEKRATSVYLVDRVVPMLPEILSNNVCSLNPNTDKLTFSVIVVMDNNANIKKTWIGRTIINSNRRFNYEEVQKIIETHKGDYADEISKLNQLAQTLRKKRFENGAISFDRGELRFKIDKEGKPIEVLYKKAKQSNQLVEEFMLIANKKVAERIGKPKQNQTPKTFVYRVHDAPDYDKLKQFKDFIEKFGYNISLKNDKAIAASLNKLFKDLQGKPEADVIANFAIRSMARAVYTTDNIGHYGLGFKYYTHFTSPIRRYPDMMVHRLLQRYLDKKPSAKKEIYEEKCKHSSEMEQLAMNAERTSTKYKAVEFMKDKIGQTFDAYISGLTDWGIFVEIQPYKIEGMILIRDIEDDFFYFDEDSYTLIAHYSDKKYTIGNKVRVKVVRADLVKRQLDFQLVN